MGDERPKGVLDELMGDVTAAAGILLFIIFIITAIDGLRKIIMRVGGSSEPVSIYEWIAAIIFALSALYICSPYILS